MERKRSLNESQFNASARLAQRLYSKYTDAGQIIPNVGKNSKKLKGRLVPKVKLPKINKIETNAEDRDFPPLHYPKGFEQFTTGMDAKAKERAEGKLPAGLSKLEITLRDSPDRNRNMFKTVAVSPMNDKPLLKTALMPPSRLLFNEKMRYSTIGGAGPEEIRSVTMLRKVSFIFDFTKFCVKMLIVSKYDIYSYLG